LKEATRHDGGFKEIRWWQKERWESTWAMNMNMHPVDAMRLHASVDT